MQTSTSAHEAHTSANIRRRASTPSGPIGASASTAPSTALDAAATVRSPPHRPAKLIHGAMLFVRHSLHTYTRHLSLSLSMSLCRLPVDPCPPISISHGSVSPSGSDVRWPASIGASASSPPWCRSDRLYAKRLRVLGGGEIDLVLVLQSCERVYSYPSLSTNAFLRDCSFCVRCGI